jgi:hypothetical protein
MSGIFGHKQIKMIAAISTTVTAGRYIDFSGLIIDLITRLKILRILLSFFGKRLFLASRRMCLHVS